METLKLSTKLSYGLGDFGPNIVHQTVSFFLLYYLTNVAGISPALAGFVLMLGKLWDAVTDPLMGVISDKTSSRFGRRRVYFLVSALPLALSFYLLWATPDFSEMGKFWYTLAIVFLYSTAITIFSIPYSALTPELTPNYHERTSLTSFRMLFAILGTLVGAGLTGFILNAFGQENIRAGFNAMSIAYGAVVILTCVVCFWGTGGHDKEPASASENHFKAFLTVLRNKTFAILFTMFVLNTIAITAMSANLVYFINDVTKLTGVTAQIPLAMFLVIAMFALPVWVWLSKRIDKKYCHMLGMAVLGLSILGIAYVGANSTAIFFSLVGIAGFAASTTYIFNWAMVPDCIELDELENGTRREGLFYGIWFFGQKLGMAVGIWMNGLILSFVDYQKPTTAGQVVTQTETALSGIQFLMGPLPAIFLFASIFALAFYPMTGARFAEVAALLKQRTSSKAAEL